MYKMTYCKYHGKNREMLFENPKEVTDFLISNYKYIDILKFKETTLEEELEV